MNRLHRGFTLVEILTSIAIIILVFGIGTYAFVSAKRSASLNTATDGLVFMLDQAKTNALAGKNGQNFGVYFDTYSYTYFAGSSYSVSNASNVVRQLGSGYKLTISLSAVGSTTIFSRLTGVPSATGTITVTDTSSSKTQTVTVGNQGEITVVK
jgi:prepilin-type N-terminal cleavage/methylation domain-containing protein